MTTIASIHVGDRLIGPDAPCFLVAEIGINHNGDMKLARQMIDAAVDAGADAVKFQNYRTENMVMDRALMYRYISQGKEVLESQFDMFKRCELKPKQLAELCEYAKQRGIICFSTPMDGAGVDECVQAECLLLKNGSDCLGHLPLIENMAKTGLPTVISTGMATAADIDDAVRAFRSAGGKKLILLHCTSSYPTPPEDVNLHRLSALAQTFGCHVGFSDHTDGVVAAIGATLLGACFIEKHFTLDKNLPGPDHRFSCDPQEWERLVVAVRTIAAELGNPTLGPVTSEEVARRDYRLSCAASRSLSAGYCLQSADIVFLRPGHGVPPKNREWLIGATLKRPVIGGQIFAREDLL